MREDRSASAHRRADATFVWGLKRSGIHLVVNWLFTNCGALRKDPLQADGLHPQLRDGFSDASAGVAFHNNCGGLHSRGFELGGLATSDLQRAAGRQRTTIFGVEDCQLDRASLTAPVATANVLVLRDPLNNLASRLKAAEDRPQVFRVDAGYIDLYEAYCAEYLGRTSHLDSKILVSFNRFIADRPYRDALAHELGVDNVDDVSEVSGYGGGSSFSSAERSSVDRLRNRFREHPVPPHLVHMLSERPAIREVCASEFGYDLLEMASGT